MLLEANIPCRDCYNMKYMDCKSIFCVKDGVSVVRLPFKKIPTDCKDHCYGLKDAKADAGKPRLTLVPRRIIFDIAKVREYGNAKYGDPDNWKTVEKERYRDAAFRHFMAYLDDPSGVDSESGLPHLSHLACNIAFLCEMENTDDIT